MKTATRLFEVCLVWGEKTAVVYVAADDADRAIDVGVRSLNRIPCDLPKIKRCNLLSVKLLFDGNDVLLDAEPRRKTKAPIAVINDGKSEDRGTAPLSAPSRAEVLEPAGDPKRRPVS